MNIPIFTYVSIGTYLHWLSTTPLTIGLTCSHRSAILKLIPCIASFWLNNKLRKYITWFVKKNEIIVISNILHCNLQINLPYSTYWIKYIETFIVNKVSIQRGLKLRAVLNSTPEISISIYLCNLNNCEYPMKYANDI